jgi:Tc toxin complex TcA C-terminal TcB-binding domain/Neuraminidase-like domain/Concanavalin A-like lectin/glucanases superfamily/Salmonella virulence plasmid 28.1kDa A protein
MSTIKISDSKLDSFYSQNPNFDILQYNLCDETALSQLNWQNLDRPALVELLKKYQRLLRLNPNPEIAKKLLNPSPDNAGRLRATPGDTINNGGLDSAHAIAAIPETEFIQNYSASAEGEASARQLHQKATAVKATITLLWANLQNMVAAPHFRAMQANNIADSIHQFENFPNYQYLFGSLDYCKCEHCQSIFSPSAYFVDLMRITQEHITSKNNIDPKFTLNTRRPDLAQIPLTCENTNNLLPYLDIVNKVLALKVYNLNNPSPTPTTEDQKIDNAYNILATATYPFNLPFNLPLEQIRAYLRQLNTNLATVYKTFNVAEKHIAREYLGLSIEEYNLITTPKTTADDLSKIYGVDVSTSDLGGLINVETFLHQTGLSRQESNDLLYQNLSQAEIESGLAHNFYINQVLPGRQYLSLTNLSVANLSVGNLVGYWALNEGFGTTIKDKPGNNNGTLKGTPNWQSVTDFSGYSSAVLPFDGTSNYVELLANTIPNGDEITISFWSYGDNSLPKNNSIIYANDKQDNRILNIHLPWSDGQIYFDCGSKGDSYDRIAKQAQSSEYKGKWSYWTFTKNASTGEMKIYLNGNLWHSETEKYKPLPPAKNCILGATNDKTIAYYYNGKIAEVRIWNKALSADVIKTNYENYNLIAINNLNLVTLDRINRFIRLAKKLNWSFADLDWVLHSIFETQIKKIDEKDINEKAIIQIAKIKQLAAVFNQPLDVICSFIFDLKTIGVGDSQNSQALFDIIFNNSKLLQGKPPYHPTSYNYLTSSNYPTYPGNALYSDTPLSTSDPNNKTRIAAGLGISLDDLTSLINAFWKPKTESDVPKSKTEPGVDVPKLSILYRHSKLAAFLRLPIDQYLILLRLINQHKSVFAIQDIVDILDHVAWLMNLGFNVYELDYILNGNESAFVFNKYNDKDIQSFLQTLWTLSVSSPSELEVNDIIYWTSFLSRIKEPINEQKDILIQRLWELFPQTIQEIINSQKLSEDTKKYEPLTQDNKNQIIKALNEILNRRDFYQEDKFKDVQISNDIQQLLVSTEILSQHEIYKLNRLLLENSFPNEIAKGKIQEIGDEWKNQLIEQLAKFLGGSTGIITALLELINKFTTLPSGVNSYTDVFLTPLQDTDFNESNLSWEYIKKILHSLARYLLLNQKLQLTQTEIDSVVSYPGCYGIEFPQPLSIDNIKSLYTFKQLTKAFNDTQDRLIQYFALQENLISYWPLNEGTGTTIFDKAGNNNGTLPGTPNWQKATDFPGGSRSVLQFDGATHIEIADPFENLTDFTIEVWVKPSVINDGKYHGFIGKQDPYRKPSMWLAPTDGGLHYWSVSDSGSIFNGTLPNFFTTINKWVQVTWVKDSTEYKFYRDGQLFATQPAPQTVRTDRTKNYLIGGVDNHWQGQIAKVCIWNVALSADAIQANYNNPNFTNLAQITDWKPEQINHLATSHFQDISNLKKTIAGIVKLKNAFDLSQSLGINIPFSDKILALADTGVDGNNWEIYTNTAQSISEILKAKYNDDDWAKVSDKLNSELKELKRNALTAFTLWKINQENNSIQTLRNLSEYLLIDVETSGCASISYIKQAILSMQMYLQRCRLNLELGVNNIDIPEIWWEWMMNYRVWEANRKVFLYPENYIEPNLRKSKSDLFQEFEAELLQSDITPESVEAAYYNYFDKLAELAQLKIASTYRCFVKQPNSTDTVDTLFIFGKTATEPVTYYYRECTVVKDKQNKFDSIIWGQWSKIDITINSPIRPVFAFNKLFIFWVEIKETSETTITDGKSTQTTKQTQTIKYTFQTVSKKWIQPQTLKTVSISSVWKVPFLFSIFENNCEKILIAFGDCHSDTQTGTKNIFDQSVNLLSANLLQTSKQQLVITGNITQGILENYMKFYVQNQTDWFLCDSTDQDETFLEIPSDPLTKTINEDSTVSSSENQITLIINDLPITGNLRFIRLTTNTVTNLSQKAFIGGIDHLLTLDSQLTPELDFTRIHLSSSAIAPKSKTLDFNGSFGLYFQEIFFHIPFLVANTLNTNQRFAEAQKWYHYIFNPTQQKQNHEGLVGYWQLNEETGTTISDKAGNNNGTVQGTPNWQKATDFPGGSRSVLQFENNIAIAVPLNEPEAEVTHELWFKTDSPNGGLFSVTNGIEKGNGDDRHLYLSNGNIKARIWNNEIIGSSNLNLADNKWHHVAHVFGASISGQKIYIDGQLVASGSKASSDFNWQNTIFIGYSYDAKPQYFQGQIAEVRIWNKALSSEQILENASPNPSDRFWRYLPFRGNTFAKLQDILTNSQAIAAYNNDPFDPHAIAQLRIGAYQKTIVMKYIDNLLDWGDNLFAQDNWESITQATMLYLLAYDLLGAKPEKLGKCKVPKPATFQNIQQKYQGKEIPEFLIELENMLADSPTSALTSTPFNDLNAYFGVSENEQFTAYWDRVEDRLYKIRHCQNIEGIVRQLALFEPPIDPSQLVRAVASGNVPMSVISGLTAEVPHYRFDYMLERARNIISTVIQLGSSLLNTLEKKDAEQISLLRSTHESVILRLIQTTKEKQINEAQANLESLNKSLEAANHRVDHYYNLISGGLNASEISSLALAENARETETDANVFNTLAAASYALPNIFGLADGGMNFGAVVQMAGATLSGIASNLNQGSSLAATIAQYERRTEDWQLQLQMAQDDVNLITQQITASLIYVDIATCELKAHQKSIEQANEVEDFFKNKFSNQDLYQWMVSRLSVLYFQTFKIALDMALATQKAYQYELNKDDTYISFDYWDSLKKGLLAGEGLMFGLNQLEKAYIEGNERKLEIEKTISLRTLKTLDNDPFEKLKAGGKCKFELNEKLFEDDFPGHYCRQIKTISISIPAVIGSYENIKATLTQLSDKILLKPNLNAVNYLLGNKQGSTQPDTSILRSSWRRNQKIALSKGVNDTGLFELNFRDERYLPFEGTGAISTWELSLPSKPSDQNSNIDSQSLSDVIINLSYTALAGDDEFQKNVEALRDKKH